MIAFLLTLLYLVFPTPGTHGARADTARKSEVAAISAHVSSYLSNNRGHMPSVGDLSDVDLAHVKDIKQATYTSEPTPTQDTAVYTIGEDCSGQKASRYYSVTILLSDNSVYCSGY